MVNSTEFGKRLQEILHYYGLSATAFSEAIDFNRSTISHLLSGRNRPSLEFVMKVLQQFPEVELYWLLNGTGTFPAEKIEPALPSSEAIESDTDKKSSKKASKSMMDVTKIRESADEQGDLEQIILFFKDGNFKVYKNHK